jgi:phosphoribosylaminoimidazole-succinocarboxamide synthase
MDAPEMAVTHLDLPGIPTFKTGKVRQVFDLGETLLLVATDRISAFDVVFKEGVPKKGQILTAISDFWFQRTSHIVPNHVLSVDVDDFPATVQPFSDLLRGRTMWVQKAELIPFECVVRGYLVGSGWKDYQKTDAVCGHLLPSGLRQAEKLETPLFTPATKAESGHDENVSVQAMVDVLGAETTYALERLSIRLYKFGRDVAAQKGLILADTKFEFGRLPDGTVILIDEAMTPDSSRYWLADHYRVGNSPMSLDKQILRDYLETTPWNKRPPAPALPSAVLDKLSEAYQTLLSRLTS